MIILPLIERELRARARSRALYWTRFAVALGGLVFCLPMATMSGMIPGGQRSLGHSVFTNIVMAAFLLSCCAGFVTVDSISRERREGTLALLYLTRVKALDVLLGSFGAAGIACVCALVAFLPVIMLPVLTGGVTGGEAFRMMLVLLDTLLLSLAAGLWASAGARGSFKCARALVGVLLLTIMAPPFVGNVGRILHFSPSVSLGTVGYAAARRIALFSPAVALDMADDVTYGIASYSFWLSLAAVLLISGLLLIAAGFRLRRAMRDGDGMAESFGGGGGKAGVSSRPLADASAVRSRRGFTLVSWNIGYREGTEEVDPVRWLVRRQRGIKAAIWAGVLAGVIPVFLGPASLLSARRIIPGLFAYQPAYMALSLLEGCLFGWAASRFFVEGRRNGELELLLTSPLGAKTIVSSQWKELKRLFAWPVIILVGCQLMPTAINAAQFYSRNGAGGFEYFIVIQFLTCVSTIFGIGALLWAGLWFGLRARSQAGALVRIILLGQVGPYLAALGGTVVISLLAVAVINGAGVRIGFSYPYGLYLVPTVVVLIYYVWLIRWARRRLAGELRTAAPVRFGLRGLISGAGAGMKSVVNKSRNWPPAPEE